MRPVDQSFLGTLYFASNDSVLHELRFFTNQSANWDDHSKYFGFGDADLEYNDLNQVDKVYKYKITKDEELTLWSKDFSRDPLAFTGFSIVLKYRNYEVTISIVNDDFDISNFTSELIRIERVK